MKKEVYTTKKRSELLDSLRSARKDLCNAMLRPPRSGTDVKKRQLLRKKIARISAALSQVTTVAKEKEIVDDTGKETPSKAKV
ncbi:MAG: hypothetical protein OYG31_00245 [Candidatus Kaiserbacteria bacterium]|nr:hypothetical protein [Candidatus Kaiserbacteria bacterium]